MNFIFTSNFSALSSSCLNSAESSHILHKHTDTEDMWVTTGSPRNNLIYAFLLEKVCFSTLLIAMKMN